MTMTNTTCTAAPRTAIAPRISVLARLAQVHAVWRQRQKLKALDDDALKDIGVTRAQARKEAARSVWDAPVTWKR